MGALRGQKPAREENFNRFPSFSGLEEEEEKFPHLEIRNNLNRNKPPDSQESYSAHEDIFDQAQVIANIYEEAKNNIIQAKNDEFVSFSSISSNQNQ